MAEEQRATTSLPQYYGEKMQDDTVVERPSHDNSHDQLLHHSIQQPHEAHVNDEEPSPYALPQNQQSSGGQASSGPTPNRSATKRSNAADYQQWLVRSEERQRRRESEDDYYGPRQRRFDPYFYPEYRGPERGPHYRDDEYDDYDAPRPYRRPSRRLTTRPPPSHQNFHHRFDRERPSFEDRYDYEPDTPTKGKVRYTYGSEDDEGPRHIYGEGHRRPLRKHSSTEVLRLPWTMWMNSAAKNHFVAFIGEFVGTAMFLFFAFAGTQVANIGAQKSSSSNTTTGADTGFSPIVLLYISLVFAFSLMVNVWVFFRISGGLFNPAVTFAMLISRAMSPVRFCLIVTAQLAGAIFSSFLVKVLFPTPLNVRTTLSQGTSLVRGVFIEAILSAELVFTIFMLAKEKHKATFIAPVGIGLALFIGELVGIFYTGGSLNPARSFGPCVVTGVFDREHWIYWVGPGFGAVIAVSFYKFIKILEYEVANPGQDNDDKEEKDGQA